MRKQPLMCLPHETWGLVFTDISFTYLTLVRGQTSEIIAFDPKASCIPRIKVRKWLGVSNR